MPDVYKKLGFVGESITELRRHFMGKKAVIGFAGAPWTLACYLVEGQLSKQKTHIRQMMYTQPKLLHAILDKLTQATIDYLCMQAQHGAAVLMLFDSHADILTPHMYGNHSVSYMQTIIEKVRASHKDIPFIIYSKASLCGIKKIASETATNCISLPWQIDLAAARKQLGPNIALQGNLDPALLYADESAITSAINTLVQSHPEPGLIINLGHGMLPDTSPDKVFHAANTVANLCKETETT